MEALRGERTGANKSAGEVKSSVITVFSTKGGVGKTTIAANLAVALASASKKKVAFIDMDLQFGDVKPSSHPPTRAFLLL